MLTLAREVEYCFLIFFIVFIYIIDINVHICKIDIKIYITYSFMFAISCPH